MADLRSTITAVRSDGRNRDCRCPAHDDHRASLSVGVGADGRILLKCHAGCGLDSILTAGNLEKRDLFPEKTTTKASIVAEYAYHDEGGRHLFDVCRFEPKDFRQRRADGVWKMTGVRRVLFRLNELQGKSVAYLGEGEKDVNRLWTEGLPATTNPGGAEKWLHIDKDTGEDTNRYAQQLIAAGIEHVVVLPDNDDAGRAHGAQAARACQLAGLKVKVVALPDLPVKGDVSDWFDAGHTKAELVALVKATPLYAPDITTTSGLTLTTLKDLLAEPDEQIEWLVDDRIPAGGLVLLAGKPKAGKSTAVRDLVKAVADGSTWLGHRCAQGAVWLLALEEKRSEVRKHFRQMGATGDDPFGC